MPLPARNLLAGQTSPCLLQLAANPVHWRMVDCLIGGSQGPGTTDLTVGRLRRMPQSHVMAHEPPFHKYQSRSRAAVGH